MHIPHIDKSCILHSIPIFTRILIVGRFRQLIQILRMCVNLVPIPHMCGVLIPILHIEKLVLIIHLNDELVPILHIWEKAVPVLHRCDEYLLILHTSEIINIRNLSTNFRPQNLSKLTGYVKFIFGKCDTLVLILLIVVVKFMKWDMYSSTKPLVRFGVERFLR